MIKAEFFAEIKEIHPIMQWLKVHLEKKGFDSKTIRRMELALEEAVANIIHHGKKGKIEIGIDFRGETVAIVLKDFGPPFDPLTEAPEVDPGKVGGLGIFLMKQVMDEITYQRLEGANVLTLFKRFSRKK